MCNYQRHGVTLHARIPQMTVAVAIFRLLLTQKLPRRPSVMTALSLIESGGSNSPESERAIFSACSLRGKCALWQFLAWSRDWALRLTALTLRRAQSDPELGRNDAPKWHYQAGVGSEEKTSSLFHTPRIKWQKPERNLTYFAYFYCILRLQQGDIKTIKQ